MEGQAQTEARYIKSALKIKTKVKGGRNPYGDNHNILGNGHYCSTWSVRYLDKNNELRMQHLEEKSNDEYIPVQDSQGLRVGPPVEVSLHRAECTTNI
jgi:hypothetical protein